MPSHADPALDTLFLPFADGRLAWPEGGTLFLRGRDGAALHVSGNAPLRAAYPQAQVYASDAIRTAMGGFLADYRAQLVGMLFAHKEA